MKKSKKIFIKIPNPCSEDWEFMTKDGQGRHCDQCNTVVYDFSEMSDDQVLHFFDLHPATHCGRFHNSQLGRGILPARNNSNFFITGFGKIAAAFFAVLSFKSVHSNAAVQHKKASTVNDANFRNRGQQPSDTIVISGIVKDNDGKPLENAVVMFDSAKVATTDKEGRFSFEPGELASTNHNLYFSWGDLITAVRSYHPVMLTTRYNIELYKKSNGNFHTAGIFLPADLFVSPPIVFRANSSVLTDKAKKLLIEVATQMKNNPSVKIVLSSYPPVCGKQYVSAKQLDVVKKYLVNSEGIASGRIATNCEVDAGANNLVEIKAEY